MRSDDAQYALGKLRELVGELATGSGDARARVYDVMRGLWALRPEDFPLALRNSFRAITSDIDRRRKPEGGYRYTNRTAARTAGAIYGLYRDLEVYVGQAARRHDSAMRIYEALVSDQCREVLEQRSPDMSAPAESVYIRFEPWHEDTPTARYDPDVPCVIVYRRGAQTGSDYDILPTVRQAADPLTELLLVAHELGHHHSNLSFSFCSFEACKPRPTYAEEVRAWELGRRLLARWSGTPLKPLSRTLFLAISVAYASRSAALPKSRPACSTSLALTFSLMPESPQAPRVPPSSGQKF